MITVATWILALVTALLVIYARKAYLAQRQQLRDQRALNAKQVRDSRRAQAERVFTRVQELPNGEYSVCAVNRSDSPIYEVRVILNAYKSDFSDFSELMPGEEIEVSQEGPIKLDDFNPCEISAAIRFRDAAGVRWQATDQGELQEVK